MSITLLVSPRRETKKNRTPRCDAMVCWASVEQLRSISETSCSLVQHSSRHLPGWQQSLTRLFYDVHMHAKRAWSTHGQQRLRGENTYSRRPHNADCWSWDG